MIAMILMMFAAWIVRQFYVKDEQTRTNAVFFAYGCVSMMAFIFCVKTVLKSRKANRHFAVLGACLSGAALSLPMLKLGDPNLRTLGLNSYLPGVLTALVLAKILDLSGRNLVPAPPEDFAPERIGGIRLPKPHRRLAGLAVAILVALCFLLPHVRPQTEGGQFYFLLAAVLPTQFGEIWRSKGRPRTAKLLGMGLVLVLILHLVDPRVEIGAEILMGILVFTGLGSILLKLQLDWEPRDLTANHARQTPSIPS